MNNNPKTLYTVLLVFIYKNRHIFIFNFWTQVNRMLGSPFLFCATMKRFVTVQTQDFHKMRTRVQMPVFFFSALPVSSVDLGSSTTNELFTDPVIIYDLMVTSEQYYEKTKLWQALIGFRWEQTGHRCSDFSRSGQAEKSVNEQNLLFCSLVFLWDFPLYSDLCQNKALSGIDSTRG